MHISRLLSVELCVGKKELHVRIYVGAKVVIPKEHHAPHRATTKLCETLPIKASSGERVDRAAVQIPLFSHPPGEKRCADPPVFCENTSILRDLRVI